MSSICFWINRCSISWTDTQNETSEKNYKTNSVVLLEGLESVITAVCASICFIRKMFFTRDGCSRSW
uniref:Ovule protein n=1 Tax=Ascaris lumbricoides TaxID=6252 RepID=A0A0M3HW80_ASCLU